MHPCRRDIPHDRVVRRTHLDLKGMLGTMGRVTGILVFKRLARGIFNLQRFSIVGLPPAHSDDIIVCLPVGKGIIGSVYEERSPTLTNVFHKSLLHRLRPSIAIVVEHDTVVRIKVWQPFLPRFHLLRPKRQVQRLMNLGRLAVFILFAGSEVLGARRPGEVLVAGGSRP